MNSISCTFSTEEPSCTSVASIPTHSPHVVSTRGPSDADAALLGTDRESYQESGSPVYLTASDIASHQTTSTQCLSSSTGVPMQAFRSCIPSFPPPLVHCSPTDDSCHSPFFHLSSAMVAGRVRLSQLCHQWTCVYVIRNGRNSFHLVLPLLGCYCRLLLWGRDQ